MGLFSKSKRNVDAEMEKARKVAEKWRDEHEARWHMRPGVMHHPEAADAVRQFCVKVGFVQRATLAEVRESERDPVRLLVGLRVGKEILPRFDEVAAAVTRSIRAQAPGEDGIEVEPIDADTSAPSPYDVFP